MVIQNIDKVLIMKLTKFHILKYLHTNEDIICYMQEVLINYKDKKTLEDTLRVCCWALRLQKLKMRLWLWKLNKKSKKKK